MDSRFVLKGVMLGVRDPISGNNITNDTMWFEATNGSIYYFGVEWGDHTENLVFIPALLDISNIHEPLDASILDKRKQANLFEGFIMPDIERPYFYNYAKILKVEGIGYMNGSVLGGEIASGGRIITGSRKDTREIKIHGSLVGSYDEFLYYIKNKTEIVLVFHDTVCDGVVYASARGVVTGLEYDAFSGTNNFVFTFVAENESFYISTKFKNQENRSWRTDSVSYSVGYNTKTKKFDIPSYNHPAFKHVIQQQPGQYGEYWYMAVQVFADISDVRSPFVYSDSVDYEFSGLGVQSVSTYLNSSVPMYDYNQATPYFYGSPPVLSLMSMGLNGSYNVSYNTFRRSLGGNNVEFGPEATFDHFVKLDNLRNGLSHYSAFNIKNGSSGDMSINRMRFVKNGF